MCVPFHGGWPVKVSQRRGLSSLTADYSDGTRSPIRVSKAETKLIPFNVVCTANFPVFFFIYPDMESD